MIDRTDAIIILLNLKNEYIKKKDSKTALALSIAIKDMIAKDDTIIDTIDERYSN